MWNTKKVLLFCILASIFTASFAVVPTSATTGTVMWTAEDTITKGDWFFNPKGSPFGSYGSCAHILPNDPQKLTQVPVGKLSVPVGGFGDLPNPPYNWTVDQTAGLPFYKQDPTYWDEFATQSPPTLTYYVNGTRFLPPTGGPIQYPVFEFSWQDWHSTQTEPREVYYTMLIPGTGGGPGWRLSSWDDGGERSQPSHGYMNFTLTFAKGDYYLSLYAYDYERTSRWSEEYRIYDSTGTTLLASKGISGTVFDEGVYEIFRVTAPDGGLKIIVQVYNDAGHVGQPYPPDKTNNVVLSGIFVDCIKPPQVGGQYTAIDSSALTEKSNPNGVETLFARGIWAALPLIAVPLLTLLGAKILKRRRFITAR